MKKFTDVTYSELEKAIAKMCENLNISPSVRDEYDLLATILDEQGRVYEREESKETDWERIRRLRFFLNYFAGRLDYPLWKDRRANKLHIDEFGTRVSPGEQYLVMDGYGRMPKLSVKSVQTMWDIIVMHNGLEKTFEKLQAEHEEKQHQKLAEASSKAIAWLDKPDDPD